MPYDRSLEHHANQKHPPKNTSMEHKAKILIKRSMIFSQNRG